jgi:hypothetical protein
VNSRGDESNAYNSLKKLMQEEGFELPTRDDVKNYLTITL